MTAIKEPMTDASPLSPPAFSAPAPPPRPRSRGLALVGLPLAFLLGGGLVAWAHTEGYLARILPSPVPAPAPSAGAAPRAAALPLPAGEAARMAAISTVEGRLALIEDRLSRVDALTHAASGNASRAESLLIAFAARRLVERGQPLGYVADQLRLRFADAQPRSVQTVLAFASRPVTLDELSARLEALSPELAVTDDESLWTRVRREASSLFVVRRDASALVTPSARIERARMMLSARRLDQAVGEVERLPGADAADTWIADARRYQAAQAALDLIETTAMLEPSRLGDGTGARVDQPSPLAGPSGSPPPAAAQSLAPETTPAPAD